jgi:hypothetical protein
MKGAFVTIVAVFITVFVVVSHSSVKSTKEGS